jgi:hypothetical protein
MGLSMVDDNGGGLGIGPLITYNRMGILPHCVVDLAHVGGVRMGVPLCKHMILIAVEDRGPYLRWRCSCGWWTDTIRGPGEQIGDKTVMSYGDEEATSAA